MTWLLPALLIAGEWGIRLVMIPVILGRRFESSTAMAWLLLIFFLPWVGLPVYLLVGVSYLGKRRARSYRRVLGQSQSPGRVEQLAPHVVRPPIAPEQRNMILQAEQMSGNPIVGGNAVELLSSSQDLVERFVADLDAAEHHLHLLYYIVRPDEVGEAVAAALKRAVGRGVRVRFLVDHAGSRPFFRRGGMADDLRRAGVQVQAALPVRLLRRKLSRIDLRNHRKLTVIDGRIAYTGSHNLVERSYGHKHAGAWVDLSGRFLGPVVAQLQLMFLDDWAFETEEHLSGEDLFPPPREHGPIAAQAVPTGPNHEGESFRRVLVAALNSAQRRIIMTTPYLVLDEPTMLALSMAADRGVETDIVVPARGDHPLVEAAGRSAFETLMDYGVNIHLYRDGMLHAKTITIDDAFALLGSANLDIRSFFLNFELNVLLYGPQITQQLRFAQRSYLAEADRVDLQLWRSRPPLRRYTENAAALLSPLL